MAIFLLTDASGRSYRIEGECRFGRAANCTHTLQDSQVSRRHATVIPSGNELVVRDEGSANGTFINDQRIGGPTTLAEGDQLRLGSTTFTLHVQPDQAETMAPTPVPSEDAGRPKSKSACLPWFVTGCGALGICLAAVVGFGLLSGRGLLDAFPDVASGNIFGGDYTLEGALAEEATDERAEVMAYLGLPDAFTISQVIVDGVPLRLETWRYHGFGTRVDFVDGEVAWTIDIEPVPEYAILPAWYDPLSFELGMSPSEAAQVATAASPAGMSPESVDLSDGGEELVGSSLLVGDQIMIGLDPAGVVYVETMAMFPEEGGD